MKLEDLKPGRELDVMVAKALGWDVRQDPGPAAPHFIIAEWAAFGGERGFTWSNPGQWYRITDDKGDHSLFPRADELPNFSYDVDKALRIAWQHLRESGEYCCLTIGSDHDYCWRLSLTRSSRSEDDKHEPSVSIDGIAGGPEGLAFGICLAFLKAKGVAE